MEETKLRVWREILKDIQGEYPGNRSLPNVLENIEQRIKYYESKNNSKEWANEKGIQEKE